MVLLMFNLVLGSNNIVTMNSRNNIKTIGNS